MGKICIALPAYNEEKTIGKVISDIFPNVPNDLQTVVIVVDDGSSDLTTIAAINAGADVVVKHEDNMGVGQAIKTCIDISLMYSPDIVCTLDADGQHHSSDLSSIIRPILRKQGDMVIGSRFINSHSVVPVLIRTSNKLMALFMSILTGIRITDAESGFRAMTGNLAANLNLLGLPAFSHEMLMDVAWNGYNILEMPIRVTYFDDRVSRVVKGIIGYGITSIKCIILKALSMLVKGFNFKKNPAIKRKVIHESERARRIREAKEVN